MQLVISETAPGKAGIAKAYIKMTTNLKLGSNWKSCGVGADMRRFAHGNARVRNVFLFFVHVSYE